jgi:tetratricopeptide (TPR) repeat protein
MQAGQPLSREQKRKLREERIQDTWRDNYYALVNGEVTLAEILQHPDEKLMQVADKGLRLMKLGKYEQARGILAGLPMLDPYVPYFHMLLGTLYEKLGEPDDALAEYQQAVDLCESMDPPGSLLPFALLSQTKLLTHHGQLQDALAIVRRMVSGEVDVRDPRLQREAQMICTYLESAAQSQPGS